MVIRPVGTRVRRPDVAWKVLGGAPNRAALFSPTMVGALLAAPAGAGHAVSANNDRDHYPSVVGAHGVRPGTGPPRHD